MPQEPDAPNPGSPDVPARRAAVEAAQDRALDAMSALLRQQARDWAARIAVMADLDDLTSLGAKAGAAQYPHLEMAGSWNVSQLTAERWRWEAERFTVALPRTLAMLSTGELLEHQAKVLLHRARHCTDEVAQAVEAEVLPAGAELYPHDLGVRVDRAVLRIESAQADAAAAEQRHADAAAERRTFTKPGLDGMGLAGAVLTAEQLTAWQAGLDKLERRERLADREAGIERTAEQRRADLFAALPAMVLAGTAQDQEADAAGAPRRSWTLGPEQLAAHVVLNVHVPVATLLERSTQPGSLDRYGPISAEHVRLLRPSSFRRVLVDSRTGRPIAVDDRPTPASPDPAEAREQVLAMLRPAVVTDRDESQHDPSARLARLVHLRDVHCCGPGCSSTHTERDHLDPYPHGPTSAANLALESPRCHHAKHAGWTLVKHPDGSSTWTSPLGRIYTRPSPHEPPPPADLYDEPPALRQRPQGAAPAHGSPLPTDSSDSNEPPDGPGAAGDVAPTPSTSQAPSAGQAADDEPPPF